MHFGNVWLLAFVCLVLGGCAVAAMPTPQTLMPTSPAVLKPAPSENDDASRLGPPSLRGLGRRRIDRAVSANTPPARY